MDLSETKNLDESTLLDQVQTTLVRPDSPTWLNWRKSATKISFVVGNSEPFRKWEAQLVEKGQNLIKSRHPSLLTNNKRILHLQTTYHLHSEKQSRNSSKVLRARGCWKQHPQSIYSQVNAEKYNKFNTFGNWHKRFSDKTSANYNEFLDECYKSTIDKDKEKDENTREPYTQDMQGCLSFNRNVIHHYFEIVNRLGLEPMSVDELAVILYRYFHDLFVRSHELYFLILEIARIRDISTGEFPIDTELEQLYKRYQG